MLDSDEWALSQHLSKLYENTIRSSIMKIILLVKIKIDGHELPNTLPDHLIPPSKRHLATTNNNSSSSYGNSGLYPSVDNNSNSGYN
jgi:hypothetical protein